MHRRRVRPALRRFPVLLAALVGPLACACSDASSKRPSAAAAGLAPEVQTYSLYIATYTGAECARELRCDGANAKHPTVEACLAAVPATLERQRKAIAASIAAGRSLYSAVDAQACLDAVRGPCGKPSIEVLAACNDVVTGRVPLGQTCVGHFECEDVPVTKGYGPYCFEGCKGLFGEEDPPRAGQCVAESPLQSPACRDQAP